MAKRRHALNPAKVKADITALEEHPPPEIFAPRLDIRRRLSVLLLCLLTSAVLGICFAPFDCWYLAYVALVPWGLAVIGGKSARWAMLWSYLAGVIFWAVGAYWLTWVTMIGYIPLVLYLGLYWLLAGWLLRKAFARGWPSWVVLPVLWVALEYLRAYLMSGFPWFFLAHSQYSRTQLIQIADVTGQYGVSFFVAMVNGAIIDAFAQPLFVRDGGRVRLTKLIGIAGAVCLVAAAGMMGYGAFRLCQDTVRVGPKIGVVQMAFPISLTRDDDASPRQIFDGHLLNSRPLGGADCDLVVWPESMLGDYEPAQLAQLLKELHCPLLAGGGMPPAYLKPDPGEVIYANSAVLLDLDEKGRLQLTRRYDKMHLVPFSEYVPFRQFAPPVHKLLRRCVPEAMPQLEPGLKKVRFAIQAQGQQFRLAAPICYEGTFARVCRDLVDKHSPRGAGVLVNISNDGWFVYQGPKYVFAGEKIIHASTELDQHLVQYVFRAIENRVPVVRAVNTGISAHIDSHGRIVGSVVSGGKRRKMIAGNMVAQTVVDDRKSMYSYVGDVFALAVSVIAASGTVILVLRRRGKETGS